MTGPMPAFGRFNGVREVMYRGGWPGLFSGESQSKAMARALSEINQQGLCCAGVAPDQWGFFKRLLYAVIASVTLGFVVRHPNLLVVTAPVPQQPTSAVPWDVGFQQTPALSAPTPAREALPSAAPVESSRQGAPAGALQGRPSGTPTRYARPTRPASPYTPRRPGQE